MLAGEGRGPGGAVTTSAGRSAGVKPEEQLQQTQGETEQRLTPTARALGLQLRNMTRWSLQLAEGTPKNRMEAPTPLERVVVRLTLHLFA